jgi:hypothetical protein
VAGPETMKPGADSPFNAVSYWVLTAAFTRLSRRVTRPAVLRLGQESIIDY